MNRGVRDLKKKPSKIYQKWIKYQKRRVKLRRDERIEEMRNGTNHERNETPYGYMGWTR